jgi:hypothetical protein
MRHYTRSHPGDGKKIRGSRYPGQILPCDSVEFLSDVRDLGLTPIVRIKRGNAMLWFYGKQYDVKELWSGFAKERTRKVINSMIFKGTHLDVLHSELDLVRHFFIYLIVPQQGQKMGCLY